MSDLSLPAGESLSESMDQVEKLSGMESSEKNEGESTFEQIKGIFSDAAKDNKERLKNFGSGFFGDLAKRGENLFGRDEGSGWEEEVRKALGDVDDEAEETTELFLSIIKGNTAGGAQEESAGFSDKPSPEVGEVVFHQGEWLDEDIGDKTKEWLTGEGHEEVASPFSPEEEAFAEDVRESVYKEVASEIDEGDPDVAKIIKEVLDGEGDTSEEALEAAKLLLRIAVKAGTKLAASIAKNISRDKDVPQELRIFMGVVSDGLNEVGDFADKMIAGDSRADLERDIIDFVTDKYN